MGDEFGGVGPDPRSNLVTPYPSQKMVMIAVAGQDRANTTIGVIATDAALTKAQCHRLAVAAHDGIARAIQPAHSPFDGDLLFAVSTGTGPVVDDMALFELGHAASVCVARAIARGVFEATPRPGDVLPTWNNRKRKAQI
jgi:D-aminopeptidase